MSEPLTLSSGDLSFLIDPRSAGRVVQVVFRGEPLLTGPSVNPDNWGATFWTSPQSDWGWPPPAEVDQLPYEVLSRSKERLVLKSPLVTLAHSSFWVEKSFEAGPQGCIDVRYRIQSAADVPFRIAGWEISRVGPSGLTFFPTGTAELTPIAPHGAMTLEKAAGVSFYDHRKFELGRSLKLHADGSEGFLAHAGNGLLLLKLFEDSPAELQAPFEGEVELFANEDGRYVEVEVQGRYELVEPGESSELVVRTLVAPITPEQEKDREGLVEMARVLRREHGREIFDVEQGG